LNLPQLEAHEAVVLDDVVQLRIVREVRVRDIVGHPLALQIRKVDVRLPGKGNYPAMQGVV